MPINTLMRLALAILVAISIGSIARADDRCNVSLAAGLGRNPPPHATPAKDRFRIFWHVATQIEDLADAHLDPARLQDIREVQKLVDGYYVNMLVTGPLVYWPDRPRQCSLNFKRIDKGDSIEIGGNTFSFPEGAGDGRQACETDLNRFQRNLGFSDSIAMQYAAMGRAFDNLGLERELKAGKDLMAEMIINSREMVYDDATDTVVLTRLPKTLCFLTNEGIKAHSVMMYQEPNIQIRQGSYLWIPQKPKGGKPVRSKDPIADKAPENPRVYDLVEDAFRREGIYFENIYANIRRWNRRTTPDLARQLVSLKEIRGFNFEGGAAVPETTPHKLPQYAEGIAWVLSNTDRNVSLLMPGYWDRDSVGSEAEIDTLPQRTRDYVVKLNEMVSKRMRLPSGKNAFCTGRVILIPGSYGKPLHVKTLPSMRNGRPAGTVTGNIRMLADLRKELCGG